MISYFRDVFHSVFTTQRIGRCPTVGPFLFHKLFSVVAFFGCTMEIGCQRFRNRYIDSVFLVLSFGWLNWSWSGKHVYCLAEFMSVHLCWTSSTDVQADNPHFMAPNKIWIFEQIKVSYDSIKMASLQYSIQHVIKPIKSFYMTHSISCPKKPKDQF